MARRITDKEKIELIKLFSDGKTIEELTEKFGFNKLTISRNLKKSLGEKKYKEIITRTKLMKETFSDEESLNKEIQKKLNNEMKVKNLFNKAEQSNEQSNEQLNEQLNEQSNVNTEFIEIAPITYEIDDLPQKDLSSIPISDINLPKVVYMIVDNKVELETKILKDYPDWQFLSQNELKRKTIEIFFDMKIAKRFCNKEQKVIKVPNANVFKIVAPILISRGISRIVTPEKLIKL